MFFDEFTPGRRFQTPTRTITETDVINFVGTCGLFEPMFVSETAARATPWGGRIVPGPLTLAVGEGLAFLAGLFQQCICQVHLDVSLLAPVRIGDTLGEEVEVLSRDEGRKPDRGQVRFRHTLRNQAGTKVMRYDVTRLMWRAGEK